MPDLFEIQQQQQQQQLSDQGAVNFTERFGCDRWPLHYACRVGNFEDVQYLVDELHCPIDEGDSHDATPLYLAALTGRDEICRFLLERGAKCNENDGDVARVFYVALTPELRRLLREWSLTAASRDPYLESLRKGFNDPTHADVIVTLSSSKSMNRPIFLHRIIVHTRCPSLAKIIVESPNNSCTGVVTNKDETSAIKFHIHLDGRYDDAVVIQVLNYLYTGVMDLSKRLDSALEIRQVAVDFGLCQLVGSIDATIEQSNFSREQDASFDKKGTTLDNIDHSEILRDDMKRLARWVSTPFSEFQSLTELNLLLSHTDITLKCLESTWSVNRFRICDQSEYFRKGFMGDFREAQEATFDVSHLLPSPQAWRHVLEWMYADEFLTEDDLNDSDNDEEVQIPLDMAVEILELSFAILCPRLSSYVANTILAPAVDRHNVFDILSLARFYEKLDRLEDKCVDVIGRDFEELKHDAALRVLLAEEAAKILQGGDIRVMDVPICAEISRAIVKYNKDEDGEEAKIRKALYLEFLQNLVCAVAFESKSSC